MKTMNFRIGRRRWLILALIVAGLYFAWSRVTAPQGVQRVQFVPANESCGSAGRMTYCVFRARAGTNGDVVYHCTAATSMSMSGMMIPTGLPWSRPNGSETRPCPRR